MSIEKLTNLLSATSSWTSRERFKALGAQRLLHRERAGPEQVGL